MWNEIIETIGSESLVLRAVKLNGIEGCAYWLWDCYFYGQYEQGAIEQCLMEQTGASQ
jgi:hypothetical protein